MSVLDFGDPFLQWAADKLQEWRPDWPTEAPNSSNPPSWFLTPKQTVFELIVWNSIFVGLGAYLLLGPGLKALELPKPGKRQIGLFDHIMAVILCGLIGFTAWYKYATDTVVYLAQPCHVVTLMLIAAIWWPERRGASLLFLLFVHMNLGTYLALMWPDTRDYTRRGIWPKTAITVFFSLHWVLAFLPYVYTARNVFQWKKGFLAVLWGFTGLGLLHFAVLLPLSLLAEKNVNYMLSPPPGPPRSWGVYYRSITSAMVLPVLVMPGIVFPALSQGIAWLLRKAVGGASPEASGPRRSERLKASKGGDKTE